MRVVSAAQMREADRFTIEELGIPSIVLMEHAGRAVVAAMAAHFGDLDGLQVAVLCGRGNNGGDGFVAARHLTQQGADVTVYLLETVDGLRGDPAINARILQRLSVPLLSVEDETAWRAQAPDLATADLILDALFGTGLRPPLTGLAAVVIQDVNMAGVPVVSIDLPSGLSSDDAQVEGDAIEATLTVTLAAPKVSLVFPPADAYAGEIMVADIGIPRSVIEHLEGSRIQLLTASDVARHLPERPIEAHKGTFGRITIVAGSIGKTGAAHLSAMAALRSGAGLVTVATPRACVATVAAMGPEYMTVPLPDADGVVGVGAADAVLALDADVFAIGPGLGVGREQSALVRELLDRATKPLVIDADGLNACVGQLDALKGRDDRPVIITPHPGEMARLTSRDIADVQRNRVDVARDFAVAQQMYVILKGHRTVVATPQGAVFVNPTGNPGMATGGTGDVLTGIVAAWLAQVHRPEAACALAVFLHGTAGDLAAAARGEVALIARDLIQYLGEAVQMLAEPDGDERDEDEDGELEE